jgi:hypothetical protein
VICLLGNLRNILGCRERECGCGCSKDSLSTCHDGCGSANGDVLGGGGFVS